MQCTDINDMCCRYLDFGLSGQETEELFAHLASCSECKREFDLMYALGQNLLLLREHPLDAPPDMAKSVLAQVQKAPRLRLAASRLAARWGGCFTGMLQGLGRSRGKKLAALVSALTMVAASVATASALYIHGLGQPTTASKKHPESQTVAVVPPSTTKTTVPQKTPGTATVPKTEASSTVDTSKNTGGSSASASSVQTQTVAMTMASLWVNVNDLSQANKNISSMAGNMNADCHIIPLTGEPGGQNKELVRIVTSQDTVTELINQIASAGSVTDKVLNSSQDSSDLSGQGVIVAWLQGK